MKSTSRACSGTINFYRQLIVLSVLLSLASVTPVAIAGEKSVVVGTLGWVFEQYTTDLAVLRATIVERATEQTGLLFLACSRGKRRMNLFLPPRSLEQRDQPSHAKLMFRFIIPKVNPRSVVTRYAEVDFRPGLSISLEEKYFSDHIFEYVLEGLSSNSVGLELTVYIMNSKDSFVRGETFRLSFDKLPDMRLTSAALLVACSRIG